MIFVVIRGRNCQDVVSKCLKSLLKQSFQDWRAMVVLDAPTDGSIASVNEFRGRDSRFCLYVNPRPYGLGHNMFWSIKWTYCILKPRPLDIFLLLDADDWLHKRALEKIGKVYDEHPLTLITYGSYIKVSTGKRTKISASIPKGANIRKYPWRASHIKTFRAGLVPFVRDDWFMHGDKWIPCASDVALMLPLIEIAGLEYCEHVSKLLYYWRDSHTDRTKQIKYEKIIRKKKSEKPMGWSCMRLPTTPVTDIL
jgi:glycosyltransferase involved in cell wall biosynthesis